MKRTKGGKLSDQVKRHSQKEVKQESEYEGDLDQVVSTGSTLLDLSISGGRIHGGGVPGGILVEVFGPSGAGKTVLLCELAGSVQRKGGQVMFHDPEARLNKQFAKLFGLNPNKMDYTTPDKVPEVFQSVRSWDVDDSTLNGVFTDSLAALSTDLELDSKEGDKMGMRRAKEFSEECRKTCRILKQNGILMMCSNQVRVNQAAQAYGEKYKSPGGEAIGFYSSLRLKCSSPSKIRKERTISGKKHKRIIGVETEIEVYKSSVWEPYRKATLYIIFNYGIDNIRSNLQFNKSIRGESTYRLNGVTLSNSMDDAIAAVEEDKLEKKLREETIEVWNEFEEKFKQNRKRKRRV